MIRTLENLRNLSYKFREKIDIGFILTPFFFGCLFFFIKTEINIGDDSYFYLVTARNLVLSGVQTFSGIFPTNGIHPLWFYVLTAYSWLVAQINIELLWNPTYAVPLSLALIAGGIRNFYLLSKILKIDAVLLICFPLTYILGFGLLYSEGHMLYFSLSLFLLLIEKNKKFDVSPLFLGSASALVFLSRLDCIFLIMAFFGYYLITEKN